LKTRTRMVAVCLALLPALHVWGDGPRRVTRRGADAAPRTPVRANKPRVNSRRVFAYYTAEQALAVARASGKPIFVISVRGNDCAGGL